MRSSPFLIVGSLILAAAAVAAAAEEPLPGVAEATQGMERRDGLFPIHLDPQRGTLLLELPPEADPAVGHQVLYVEGLTTGLGSNPVGLDRGQLGPTRLVNLRRVGGRVLVEEQNVAFRARTGDEAERRAVEESFARSVLWAGPLVAADADGRVLVDFTSFVVRDAHDTARTLERTEQGSYSLDESRSALDPAACLAFPDNLEMEALLTFQGKEPGAQVRATAPTASLVTLVQHHSLLRLPPEGYRPRRFDPRAGSFAIGFQDYAAPLDRPLEESWIVRHRLEKTDPAADRSPVVEPIVYYVDRGAPEPVRSALMEGAGWWAEAFEAAGFEHAFRVELLPEGAHPLDARYNVIQWVHRSTRGWSYGGGVTDPRTGEMIKGHVSLGSLRVRQDRLLFQGLAGASKAGTGAPDDPVELALARIRQLAAHEVGHTLGLTHNFAASTYGRASVMDYPAPLVNVTGDGKLDLSEAYGVGVGAWDLHAIRYAYAQFPPGADEARELEAIVRDGIERGLRYLTDADARPAGAAHPLANLWDNGEDPVASLSRTLEVRRIALSRLGPDALLEGEPLARLEEVLVPLYLHHRYQLEAAVKVIGGLDYTYAVRGDGQEPLRTLDPAWQRRALDVILSILDPEALDLPEPLLRVIPPRPPGHGRNRELFRGDTDPALDPLGAAATAAEMVVAGLLQPERAARLVDLHRRDPAQPGLEPVVNGLIDRTFPRGVSDPPRLAEIRRVVKRVVVDGMIGLAADPQAASGVRMRLDHRLAALRASLLSADTTDGATAALHAALAEDIRRHLERAVPPAELPAAAPEAPPGDPIGSP